ncbi:MAG: class I SAM-dependent methyltransferase [Candidatus Binatia bacterium]
MVKITASGICGSDLHLLNGFMPTMEKGDILGHESMGVVVETGAGVSNPKKADRVVVPFTTPCGECFFCAPMRPPPRRRFGTGRTVASRSCAHRKRSLEHLTESLLLRDGRSMTSPPPDSTRVVLRTEPVPRDPGRFDAERAQYYRARHRRSLLSRVVTWRENRCVYLALRDAGFPKTVLDLPCGTGRFWPAFARARVSGLIAADNSRAMLDVAGASPIGNALPCTLLQTSAFAIALKEDCVDMAVCLRFFHHLAMPEDRRRLLDELTRVSSSGYVLISTMVSGNLIGNRKLNKMRRHGGPAAPARAGYGRRFVRTSADVEAEFEQHGFTIVQSCDSFRGIDCWRFYLLHAPKAAS